ncbi:DUF4956 domain-containing protein [Eubacteriales bacterium OttesenSCG-928-K08]|nr:DUF4956 domain-containing protein [Eubacteriales bacterium OttesenSCG-928-K08]
MLNSILSAGSITISQVAICTVVSLALGLIIACVYMFRNSYSKNFVVTIALLPVLVQSVIMVVNGNLGTGVAVMGAFSLVRFRSVPGSAKEIIIIFFAMAAGLAAGMGYVVYAVLLTVTVSVIMLVLNMTRFGERDSAIKTLKVVIPEDADYSHMFDDLFSKYTFSYSLDRVRTTNLGGLYELQYTIKLKETDKEKEMLDQIRQRNGNLSITCSNKLAPANEL